MSGYFFLILFLDIYVAKALFCTVSKKANLLYMYVFFFFSAGVADFISKLLVSSICYTGF